MTIDNNSGSSLALPTTVQGKMKSLWESPEGVTAALVALCIAGGVVWFWGIIVPYVLGMLVDTLHTAELVGELVAITYLVCGKRPRMMWRVLLRKLTSLFVAVYPIEIIEDKLQQMKKRRDKMNEQISLVDGSIVRLKRVMEQNHSQAVKGFGEATFAQKKAASSQDETEQLNMQLQMKRSARMAQRREQANIGYAKLLERLMKVYKFLTRYAANVDFFIEDTEDEINQKKAEYETTMAAAGAMKQAMAVIKGNATEEDIYGQAFEYIENSVTTQLGIMDDLQRISKNFMDGMDVQTGAVDEAALKALAEFEQKALSAGSQEFQMVTMDKSTAKQPVPIPAVAPGVTHQFLPSNTDFGDLFK